MSEKHVAVFGKNRFECLYLIMYCWIKHLKILIIGEDIYSRISTEIKATFFARKYLEKSVEKYETGLGAYKGLFFEVSKETLDLTPKVCAQEIKTRDKLIACYNNILRTKKFEAYIKKSISMEIFTLLKELHLIRLSDLRNKPIVMIKNPINEHAVKYLEDKYKAKYTVKWVRPGGSFFFLCAYYAWLVSEFLRRGFVFRRKRKTYKLSKEAVWGFDQKTIRDDLVIDNRRFLPKDIAMIKFYSRQDTNRARAVNEAKKRNFDVISLPELKININKNIFGILAFYFWVPLEIYFLLVLENRMYLFCYIFLFHKKCLPIELLMNLYSIKCHLSIKEWGDIEETIIFNKYGTRNIFFHTSDLTTHKAYDLAFPAQNVYFVWGDIHYYHADNSFVDEKINVGCVYKREYGTALKRRDNITAGIRNFNKNAKTVAFFDTSFDNAIYSDENVFLEFMEVMRDFCKGYPDVNVLFKPKYGAGTDLNISQHNKSRYAKVWGELTNFRNFMWFNWREWSVTEIISLADVSVNMGMNSPATIALICGRNAVYFENAGNVYHPFARRYRGQLVFGDRHELFTQVENILNGKVRSRDIISESEIRSYDTYDDDHALERMRDKLYELTS